jgi:glutamate carboxypeptidase
MSTRGVLRIALSVVLFGAAPSTGAALPTAEQKIAQFVDANTGESNLLLEKLVNINSGTFNAAGVRLVAGVLRPEAGARSTATIARRSSSLWNLRATGTSAHSAVIFSGAGSGAIYELARILSAFYDQLREPDLTYNVGVMLGGTSVTYDVKANTGSVSGKPNIIPGTAEASGDIRTLDDQQLQRVREKMRQIVARHLPGTGAEIEFQDQYPSMPSTPGNQRLLDQLNSVNRDLNLPAMEPLPPGRRGAGDLSFAGPYLDALSGLGSLGSGAHAPGETIDLASQPMQMKRSALLIYRLTR